MQKCVEIETMSKKYKISKESQVSMGGVPLYQIVAVRDIPGIHVVRGTRGGWVSSEKCLSHDGKCWIDEGSYVSHSRVDDDALIVGSRVCGDRTYVGGTTSVRNSRIYDTEIFDDGVLVLGSLIVDRTLRSGELRGVVSRVLEPLQIFGMRYEVVLDDEKAIIGCQSKKFQQWLKILERGRKREDAVYYELDARRDEYAYLAVEARRRLSEVAAWKRSKYGQKKLRREEEMFVLGS